MNIFVLDMRPVTAAQYHADKHVIKMILESAQMLSTALHECVGPIDGIYKPTHVNHPCSVWTRSSYLNYVWLYNLYRCLGDEYTYRFDKDHKSMQLATVLHPAQYKKSLPDMPLLPFVKAMPDEYKVTSAVQSYRNYYLGEKSHLLKYTRRGLPFFVADAMYAD